MLQSFGLLDPHGHPSELLAPVEEGLDTGEDILP